jgi:RNA ligase (TIGR02306 family)
MSSLIVEVCEIKELRSHTNPEVHSLDIAIVKGWQCIVKRGQYKVGDRVVFFPPDSVLPTDVSDRLGVTAYLHKGRVKSIKLKGEPSYGLVVTPDNPKWEVGRDVAKDYGVTKYEPPPPELMGRTGKKEAKFTDTEPDHPLFWKYTDMENMRHYPDVIAEGEEVVMTEKIHGTNVRIGMIRDHDIYKHEEHTNKISTLMVGSKNHRRKMPMKYVPAPRSTGFLAPIKNFFKWIIRAKVAVPDTEGMANSWFWYPTTIRNVRMMLEALSDDEYGGTTWNGGK